MLGYAYFKDNYKLIAVDLNKQALDANPRAIQQIVFQGVVQGENKTKIRLYTILKKPKETILEFAKGTAKVSKISKIVQSGGFLGRLLGLLLKTGLPLIKNVIKPLAKSVLIPLGLTAVASAADAGIHKKYWDLVVLREQQL